MLSAQAKSTIELVDLRPTNVDFLAWFGEHERDDCARCGERAVVTVGDALATFCLACGTIWINGKAIEITPQPDVVAHNKDAPASE